MWRVLGVLFVSTLIAAACAGTGDGGAGPTTLPTTVLPTTTLPPTTAGSSTSIGTTTVAPTTSTTIAPEDEVWLAMYRRDPPGYVVEFTELESGRTLVLPVDRLEPYPGPVFGDGEGGLVFEQGVKWLEAGADRSVPLGVEGAHVDGVVEVDGVPTLLYRTERGDSRWEGSGSELVHVSETTTALIAHAIRGEPRLLLESFTRMRWEYSTGDGVQQGPRLEAAGYGGGVLALLWYSDVNRCAHVELRSGLGAEPSTRVNPVPQAVCADVSPGVLDLAVSADGSVLFGVVNPSIQPTMGWPDTVAWDLRTGTEIDRIPGTGHFVHDGDRRLAFDRRESGGIRVATLTPSGFVSRPGPTTDGSLLGIIHGPLAFSPGVSLARSEPWTGCSTAGRTLASQLGLPEPVDSTRAAIGEALAACDLIGLTDLATRSPEFRLVDADVDCGEPWPMSFVDDDFAPHWYRGDLDRQLLAAMFDALEQRPIHDDERHVWTGEHGYRIEIADDGSWMLDWQRLPRPPCEGMGCDC